jgi:hypothetical protein
LAEEGRRAGSPSSRVGAIAALAAVLCLVLFLRSGRDEARRVYWLAYAVLAAVVSAVWVVLR